MNSAYFSHMDILYPVSELIDIYSLDKQIEFFGNYYLYVWQIPNASGGLPRDIRASFQYNLIHSFTYVYPKNRWLKAGSKSNFLHEQISFALLKK